MDAERAELSTPSTPESRLSRIFRYIGWLLCLLIPYRRHWDNLSASRVRVTA
jgi:hypothetical protein